MKKLAIYGAGYFDCIKVIDAINRDHSEWEILGFIDDRESLVGQSFLGHKVIGTSKLIPELAKDENTYFFTNYFDPFPNFKKRIDTLKAHNCKIPNLIHPSVDTSYVSLGEGCIIPEGCVLGSNVKMGNYVSMRIRSLVSHDSNIEDYSFIGPGCVVGSSATLKEKCFVGAGATVILNRTVGANSYIGAGSVVTHDVPDGVTVVGVPAQKIKKSFIKRAIKKLYSFVPPKQYFVKNDFR